jgi:hypothetical protein
MLKNRLYKYMKATIISHIYNEEYLLPVWLKHHTSMFDHGIIIDYGSTDNSIAIIKGACPTWEIRQSRNANFDAADVDREVMDIESSIDGIKVVLNITEFLFTDKPLKEYFTMEQPIQYRIKAMTPYSTTVSEPTTLGELYRGIEMVNPNYRCGHRYIHNYMNGNYTVGRHRTNNHVTDIASMYIIWFGFYPWNESIKSRKFQIKDKMSESEKHSGNGFQHLWNSDQMDKEITIIVAGLQNISSIAPTLYTILQSYKDV